MLTENKIEYMTLTQLTRMYPNKTMKKFIDRNIVYHNQSWNRLLRHWQHNFHLSPAHVIAYVFTPILSKKEKGKPQKVLRVKTTRRYDRVPAWITFKPYKHKDKKSKKTVIKIKEVPHYAYDHPNARSVRNWLVQTKNKYDQIYPTSIIQETAADLGKAFAAYFDPERPDAGLPKIKSTDQKITKGSYTDVEVRIKNSNHLQISSARKDPLRHRYGLIPLAEEIRNFDPTKRLHVRIIKKDDNHYYAAIPIQKPIKHLIPTLQSNGIDVNVRHFNAIGTKVNVFPQQLETCEYRIAIYQRKLAKKREIAKAILKKTNRQRKGQGKSKLHMTPGLYQTKTYNKVRIKLQRAYRYASNIQHDIVQKFTTSIMPYADDFYIESTNVKAMAMSHIVSKSVHRAMFGYFKVVMQYKCKLWGKTLHMVDQLYPSTQICPYCGWAKAGDEKLTLEGNKKHGTGHQEFICYNPDCPMYKVVQDRDDKVPLALLLYNPSEMPYIRWAQRNEAIKKQGHYNIFAIKTLAQAKQETESD